jgi:hypothetical protein
MVIETEVSPEEGRWVAAGTGSVRGDARSGWRGRARRVPGRESGQGVGGPGGRGVGLACRSLHRPETFGGRLRHRHGRMGGGTVSTRSSKPKAKIRVYLVDDDTDLLEGFAKELAKEPDISVVGTADTCAQALRETAAIKPDLVT